MKQIQCKVCGEFLNFTKPKPFIILTTEDVVLIQVNCPSCGGYVIGTYGGSSFQYFNGDSKEN
jgi:hypothetical protein